MQLHAWSASVGGLLGGALVICIFLATDLPPYPGSDVASLAQPPLQRQLRPHERKLMSSFPPVHKDRFTSDPALMNAAMHYDGFPYPKARIVGWLDTGRYPTGKGFCPCLGIKALSGLNVPEGHGSWLGLVLGGRKQDAAKGTCRSGGSCLCACHTQIYSNETLVEEISGNERQDCGNWQQVCPDCDKSFVVLAAAASPQDCSDQQDPGVGGRASRRSAWTSRRVGGKAAPFCYAPGALLSPVCAVRAWPAGIRQLACCDPGGKGGASIRRAVLRSRPRGLHQGRRQHPVLLRTHRARVPGAAMRGMN
jgi:hypothetical protein